MKKATASSQQYSLELGNPRVPASVAPTIFTRLQPAKPTIVYQTYWRFAAERQRIFHARTRGEPGPWTSDRILADFKFTNAYRAADRTSQFLIREVIFRGPQTSDELFFRILLFKIFNKIETWQLLKMHLGEIRWESFSFEAYDRILMESFNRGTSIYSAAYIVPSPRGFGYDRKHRNHLALLSTLMHRDYPQKIQDCKRMQDAFDLMRSVPSFGDFLAYQFVTDLNYSDLTDYSETEFVVAGPGAHSGLRKCFDDPGGLAPEDLIQMVTDRQEKEFDKFGLEFEDLWGRRLQLIDCQNLFCEVDKYARVAHPEFTEAGGRWRIKQVFRQSTRRDSPPWFPPQWGLNERIMREHRDAVVRE